MEGREFITPEEVAEELRVKVSVVSGWLRKGKLRGLKVGKYWRIRPEDYQAFLESQANIPPNPGSPRQNSRASITPPSQTNPLRTRKGVLAKTRRTAKGKGKKNRSP